MSVSTDGTAAQASLWMVDRAYLVAGRRARCLSRSAACPYGLSGSLRSVTLSLFRAGAGASGVVLA